MEWSSDLMANLAAIVVLLVLLLVSTLSWAASQTRDIGSGRLEDNLVKARIWTAGASLALLVVAVLAAAVALFGHDGMAVTRVLRGLSCEAAVVALVSVAAVALYPAHLCAGLWRSRCGRFIERLHLSLHLVGVYVAIIGMLSVGSRVG